MRYLPAALLFISNVQAFCAEVSVAEDRMLVVNGQRTFILGLYENPGDDAVLSSVREAGFNLVQATQDVAALDRLHAEGLLAWINTGYALDLSEAREQREAALRTMVEQFTGHPAMAIWEVPDEALWNNWYSATLWRAEEPRRLREELEKQPSHENAPKVREHLQRSAALRDLGNFAESERLMNDCWKLLGLQSPNPDLGLGNAPERSARMQQGLVAGYQRLGELDAKHPVWMNHAPRNQIAQLAAYNEAADIVGCDIYPIPEYQGGHSDLADRSASAVGAFTERMQAAAPGKPVWMVLQGFGWADLQESPTEEERKEKRRPNLEETRFMAYDAIVHGARGILYWGTYKIERDSQLWKDLLTVVKELSELQPVLSAPDAKLDIEVGYQESFGSLEWTPQALAKDAPSGVWLLVVNENPDPLRVELKGLNALEGNAYFRHGEEGEAQVVKDGKLQVYVKRKGAVLLAPR